MSFSPTTSEGCCAWYIYIFRVKLYSDVRLGLMLMFLAGWIHCDISSRNIMWYIDATGCGRGILGGLGKARVQLEEGDISDSDTRTVYLPCSIYAYLTHELPGTPSLWPLKS